MSRRPATWLLLLLLGAGSCPAEESDRAVLASGLRLDGRLDEAGWDGASRVEATPVEVVGPARDVAALEPRRARVVPDVRILVCDGALWLGVRVEDAPGVAVGVRLLLAPEGTEGAADAVALAFAPQEVRAPRYVARGPRGVGRSLYRLRGAADLRSGESWSLEVTLPLADVDLPDPDRPLRLAAAVSTRVPNVVSWAPPTSAFAGPPTWRRLRPPEGGWPDTATTGPGADDQDEDIAVEDAAEAARLEAWQAFLDAYRLPAAAFRALAGGEDVSHEALLEAVRTRLLEPLERVCALRPDLAFAQVIRADVLRTLGRWEEAERALASAARAAPGLRETEFLLWLEIAGPGFARGRAGEPTDYAAAWRRLEEARRDDRGPFARDGLALGAGLLRYAEGAFEEAVGLLEPLAARYPFDAFLAAQLERAREGARAWPGEVLRREQEARRDDLPRVRLRTSRGEVELDLFEDEAPGLVRNLIWLAEHGWYDDAEISVSVPFLGVRAAQDREPGYAVPLPARRDRLPFRGVLAATDDRPDRWGGALLLTTASALHLRETLHVIGRVREGQAVLEALRRGDRLIGVDVLRKRPGRDYHPLTVEERPAPEPRR